MAAKEQVVCVCVWVCVHLLNLFRAQLEVEEARSFGHVFCVIWERGGNSEQVFGIICCFVGVVTLFEAVGVSLGQPLPPR